MESFSVPPDTLIFLARYFPQSPAPNVITRALHFPMLVGEEPNNAAMVNCYATTFAIKEFAIQLFSLRRPKDSDPGASIRIALPPIWNDTDVLIWPSNGPANWPPPIALDEPVIELFAERWLHPDSP